MMYIYTEAFVLFLVFELIYCKCETLQMYECKITAQLSYLCRRTNNSSLLTLRNNKYHIVFFLPFSYCIYK